jgi:outer membrane protein assembly factor BamB
MKGFMASRRERQSGLTEPNSRRPIRWWPVAVIVALATTRLALVWLRDAPSTQAQVVTTLKVAVLATALLMLWAVLLSRLPGRIRLTILLAVLVLAAGLRLTVRITGVSGNVVPILAWRWSDRTAPKDLPGRLAPERGGAARPGDYSQFYGPGRNATLAGPRLARDWRSSPPRLLWRREVGEAWSSFAVIGTAAVTQEQRGEDEVVVRYDLESGHEVWLHADRTRLSTTIGGRGPRATPTLADGRVYALGATGILNCLDLESGELVWSRDLLQDHQVRLADYGMPSSPLLVGELVVVQLARVGSSLVAHRRSDGEPVWRSGDDSGSYSSPMLATLAGSRQILIVNQRSVAGHHPESGDLLWREPWPHPGEKITPPLLLGEDRLLVSAGYGAGSRLLRVRHGDADWVVREFWASPRLKSKFASMVQHRGTVYGLDDGVLTAIDPATGERLWKRGRYGHGQLILVGDLLLIQAENGDVVLVEATPEEHRELARLAALPGKTWNPPALAGRYLLVRNNREAACYELPIE